MSDIFETTEYIVKGNPDTAETPPSPGGGFDPDSLSASTNTPADADLIITKESNTWVKKTFAKVWDYIKSKIGINNSQGSANKFLNEQGTFTVVNSGKEYDLEFNNDLDEVTLTEDSQDKTTLPLVATYNGTRANYNNLSAAEQAKYRHIIFTDESGNADISDELINFTNSDVITSSATAWTNVSVLSSPLSLKTLFSRISQMFKNIRYLYNAVTPVVLWTGSQGSYTTSVSNVNYPLSKSYKNFKLLRFYINCSPDANGSPVRPYVREVSTEQLDFIRGKASHTLSMTWGYGNKTDYTDIQQSSTDTNLVVSQNLTVVTKIEGVNV